MAVTAVPDAPAGSDPCHFRNPSMGKHGRLRLLEARHGKQDSETRENTMMKQIKVHGQRVELYSLDEGRTWSSNPQSIVAYGHRKELLRLELQNTFARIDEMRDLDPDNFSEVDTPKSLTKANEKHQGHSTVDKVQIARLDTGRCVGRAGRVDRDGDQARLANHGGFHREGYPRGHRPRPDHLTW